MLKQILKFKEAIFYFAVIFSTFVWLLMQIVPQISELVKTEQRILGDIHIRISEVIPNL